MRRLMTCLVLCSFAWLGTVALAQMRNLTDLTTPTEVGTTTIPSGNYVVTDEATGRTYPLTVTTQGNMIIGPAGTTTRGLSGVSSTRPGIKKTLERELEQGVTNMIK